MTTPNKQQQLCINKTDGQCMVLAGPGTGKTFTIVQRIQHLVETGVNPEKILCLTFTDAAASEMKKRIDAQLDKIDSNINVYTYHSFCNEIIKDHPQEFELPDNYRLISDAVSRSFIKESIDNKEVEIKAFRTQKNDPYFFIKDILHGITTIKQNRLNKKQYFENLEKNPEWMPELKKLKTELEEKLKGKNPRVTTLLGQIERLETKIAKAEELWNFYEAYAKKMEKYHYIDFNDMICIVLDKFEKSKGFLTQIANQYEHILVDEYQDTNKVQNDVVFQLTRGSETKNIFVVGDDDQIIYSFQGARLDTIERFLREFPETQVICLDENMRSTQTILDVARAIVEQDNDRLENKKEFEKHNISKKLVAKNQEVIAKDKNVRFYKYADNIQEYNEIINEIKKLINSSDCPTDKEGNKDLSEIAILTRSNSELEKFASKLKQNNIPYELKDGKNIFTIKSVIVLFHYMQLLINPELHSSNVFRILLNPPFNIHPQDFMTLHNLQTKYKSLLECMRKLKPEDCVEYRIIEKFINAYDKLLRFIPNESLKDIVLEIGSKTGIFDYYLNSDINKCENIAGIKKIIDEAKEISDINKTAGLADFVEYLNTCLNEDIEIKTNKAPVKMNAVQLSTYHSAKGKEYEYVYMPSLFNTSWESKRTIKPSIPLYAEEAKTDDEYKAQKYADCIRVMYVGMTRAKHTLRLSYYTPTGSRTKLTCFVANIQDMLEKESQPFEYDETTYWAEMTKSFKKEDYDYNKDFCALVDNRLKNRAFSASSINIYLKCPRQYLYSYILDLESKAGSPDAMSYGSAIHKACEFAVDTAIKTNKYPSKEDFINAFKEEVDTLPFSSYEQRQIHIERGEMALDNYYHHLTDTPLSILDKVEHHIKFEFEDCRFTGYIDRLDKNSDGTYTIYDYKTGKAKTDKEIGIGKDHEDYYNQIGLYKYFLEKSEGVKVKETKFIFPEEPEKTFTLELTEQECMDIKDKFLDAVKNIKEYNFEPCENRGKNKTCEYCSFKTFCNLENNY